MTATSLIPWPLGMVIVLAVLVGWDWLGGRRGQ